MGELHRVRIGGFEVGNDLPLTVIAGPCAMESRQHALDMSGALKEMFDRFGVNFISERSTFQSGETGGWAGLNAAKVSVMQAPPLYHTTGEVLDVISAPGLERIARFLAHFVTAVDKAPRERINP